MRVEKRFGTRAEAEAFRAGIEYVNDPYVKVAGTEPDGDGFKVVLDDQDVVPDDDGPPDPADYADDAPEGEDG
jgi:hypothetical protein